MSKIKILPLVSKTQNRVLESKFKIGLYCPKSNRPLAAKIKNRPLRSKTYNRPRVSKIQIGH